jgi:hypothetical protein
LLNSQDQFEDTAATKLLTGAALFAPDKESRLPLAGKRTQRVDCEMELPYALTGDKGIVTQTGAQYLNGDGSRYWRRANLRASWLGANLELLDPECVPMRWSSLSRVMPAQRHPAASRGGDTVFAGIHVFLASFRSERPGGPTSPVRDAE